MKPILGLEWVTDEHCHTIQVGLELSRWLGRDPEAVLALSDAVIHPDDQEPNRMRWVQATRLREPFTSWVRMWRHDGRLIWCVIVAEPVYLGGRFAGYRGVTLPLDLANISRASTSTADFTASLGLFAGLLALGNWAP